MSSLPKFERPPVIETVLGVQFEPLPGFGNAHLGAFWKGLKGGWTQVGDVPLLESQFEQFDKKSWGPGGLQLSLSQDISARLQIRNAENNRMIQVQNGRLHYNWLGQFGEEYPSYDRVKPEFDLSLDAFKQFLANVCLGEWRPNQWEVTYVNHLPKGTVWNEPKDWLTLFPTLPALSTDETSISLESFGGEWHYEIKPQQGRLHVKLSHRRRKNPAGKETEELLVMNLTARGPISEGDPKQNLTKGLDIGHETIVRAFKELTSEKAHKYWGVYHAEP